MRELDAFDLPEWLGEGDVVWHSEVGLDSGHRVGGTLVGPGPEQLACDLLAVDDAYPEPVAADGIRVRAHQLWRHGEVLVATESDRTLLAVPGSRVDTLTALEAVTRLSRAVGASGAWAVLLRLRSPSPRR